jgi:hypothetical protein
MASRNTWVTRSRKLNVLGTTRREFVDVAINVPFICYDCVPISMLAESPHIGPQCTKWQLKVIEVSLPTTMS